MKTGWIFSAIVAALLAAGNAMADSRIVFGLHFGVPLYGHPYHYPYYYYPPYYYPSPYYFPPPVIYAPPPTIESAPPPPAAAPAPVEPTWFYCAESRGYYPYVRECPGGWQRVPAAPPPAQ